jgi:hypothetical protein
MQRLGPAPGLATRVPTISATAATERPGFMAVTVQAASAAGVATVALTYQDAGSFLSSTCGDGLVPCVADGSTYTFTIPGAHGTARYTAVAIDGAGNPAVTPLREVAIDGSPPDPAAFALGARTTLSADQVTIRALAPASAAQATLYWTDTRGVTTSRPMCRVSSGEWAGQVALGDQLGARSYVVVAKGSDGRAAFTAPATVVP